MRSRTSRGVPEWSGGKDLYIGSPVSAIGTSFGVIGIVPGPPEGSRGPTGWGHLPRGATWAVGGAPWPTWAKGTSPKRPMRLGNPRGKSPQGGRHLRGALGRMDSPPLLAAPLSWRKGQGCASPLSPAPIYSGGEGGHPYLSPWRLPPSRDTSSSPVGAWRSPAGLPRSSITTTPLCCCWMESSSTSPSLLAGSRRGRHRRAVRVLNAEVPSVRH